MPGPTIWHVLSLWARCQHELQDAALTVKDMIDIEIRGAVAIITIDNGRLNILTRELHERLYRRLLQFLRDDALKVAVLTCREGASFSAGDDLKTVHDDFGDEPDWEELVMLLPRTKPVVAAVRGHCVGQGLAYLLILSDIRFCSETAQFGFPEIRYGMGGAVAMTRLAQQIPQVVAMRMGLTGESIDAAKAAACHLINEVVPDDQLLVVALKEAEKIAAHPLAALRGEMIANARNGDLSRAEALALYSQLWDSQRTRATK